METRIYVNHLGFLPKGDKYFVVIYPKATEFAIINRWDDRLVCQGRLQAVYGGDINEGFVGCFSAVTEEGTYIIKCGDVSSEVITVHKKPYEMALRTIYNYFPTQRCGDSTTGWNAPCHLKKAEDCNTGKLIDVTGGWHQSCDTRKWTGGTVTGLLGLPELGAYQGLKRWENGRVSDELKWGNLYFHKMIREDDGLMDFVSIPNDWDDKRTRILVSDDAPYVNFFTMIAGQCKTAVYLREEDPEYARKCINFATRLWKYTNSDKMKDHYSVKPFKYHDYLPFIFRKSFKGSSAYYGDRLYALMMLYKATGNRIYLDEAALTADHYCSLQVGGDVDKDLAAACFWLDSEKDDLNAASGVGVWGPIGLCLLIEEATGHPGRNRWIDSIRKIAKQAVVCSDKNPWGLVPCYWYKDDADGCRKGGSLYYKYFYTESTLVLGNNYDILTKALFLLKGAKHTDFGGKCIQVAQRQVDWILGCNPFNASTCEGVGYNQYQILVNTDEFIPPVPQIPGGVQTGISCIPGTDSPELGVDRVTCEYDMPCTSLLMWTIKEMLEYEQND